MKSKKDRQRSGVPADIARLDFHDWGGQLIDRIKGKVTQKEKGHEMLEKIQNNFGISQLEREEYKKKMLEWQKEAFTPTILSQELKEDQVKFKRDDSGKITSPFKKYGKDKGR